MLSELATSVRAGDVSPADLVEENLGGLHTVQHR
jgi:hypothetical protein